MNDPGHDDSWVCHLGFSWTCSRSPWATGNRQRSVKPGVGKDQTSQSARAWAMRAVPLRKKESTRWVSLEWLDRLRNFGALAVRMMKGVSCRVYLWVMSTHVMVRIWGNTFRTFDFTLVGAFDRLGNFALVFSGLEFWESQLNPNVLFPQRRHRYPEPHCLSSP